MKDDPQLIDGQFSIQFVVDARSAIAQNWIAYLLDHGFEVHVISTVAAPTFDSRIASYHVVPLALGGLVARLNGGGEAARSSGLRRALSSRLSPLRSRAATLDVYRHASAIRQIVNENKPDIVHAMRLPYEGIAATAALESVDVPVVVSVWGNDFTLHAGRSPRVARMTERALGRADALHPDCMRDLTLAKQTFGWPDDKPAAVLPGGGGVQRALFRPEPRDADLVETLGIPTESFVVFNPRRISPYVSTECFFRAAALVLERMGNIIFLGAEMNGHPMAEKWVSELGIRDSVRLLAPMSRAEMAAHFKLADVVVSPARHDGTPNTLLEGLACGCFPLVGAIESVEEWIVDGENGLTFDPDDPVEIAAAISRAATDKHLRNRAFAINQQLIAEKADYDLMMPRAVDFYRAVIRSAAVRLPLAGVPAKQNALRKSA